MRRPLRSPIVAVIAIVACAYGLFTLIPDLRFAFEGEPRSVPPAPLADGTYVRISGPGEPQGFRVELSGDTRDAWLLADRKVIVLLPAAGSPPLAGEITAVGRLHRGDRARGWHPAAAAVAEKHGGEAGDYWILVAGESPEVPWGILGVATLLLLVLLLNVRWLLAAWGSRKSVAGEGSAD